MIHAALWVLSLCCLVILVTILVRRRRANRRKDESLIDMTLRIYDKHKKP